MFDTHAAHVSGWCADQHACASSNCACIMRAFASTHVTAYHGNVRMSRMSHPTSNCQQKCVRDLSPIKIRKESKRPTSPRKTWNLSTDPIHTFAKNKIHAKFKRLQTINDTFPCYLRSMLDKSNSCIHSFIESSMHSFIQFTVCTVFVLFIHVLNLFVFHFTIYTHIIYYVLLNKSI